MGGAAEMDGAADALVSVLGGGGGEGGEGGAGMAGWLVVDEAALDDATLEALWTWFEALRTRWGFARAWPACWPVHPALRAEALALWRAWGEAEAEEMPLAGWLALLDAALRRVEARWAGACAGGQHLPSPPAAPDRTWLDEALGAHAAP